MRDDENTRTSGLPEANENTRLMGIPASGSSASPPLGARASFLVAYDRLTTLLDVARRPSVAVIAVDSKARVVESLLLPDREAVIVGRHTQCVLRLNHQAVSLRHVAALLRFEAGRPLLHVLDLGTGRPFVTEDEQPSAAVVADGPLYIAIEGYALWFVPTSVDLARAGRAADAFEALAPRHFEDRRPPLEIPLHEGVTAWVNRTRRSEDEEVTHVTRVCAPMLLGDGAEPEVGWGVLKLRHGPRRERRVVSAERLERGLLLGRYERCDLLLSTPENRISRVHALLLRIGAEVWIIDAASTNGIHRGDEPVTATVLRDVDRLLLASEVELDWQRTVHASA